MRSGTDGSPPFVSVVVPVLNGTPEIEACVDALLRQTYPSHRYEIVVADNGSTDDTRAVVDRLRGGHGRRLRLVVEDRIRSSYAARNRGLREVQGSIVAFTDADCVPALDWLACGVRALERGNLACGAGRIVVTYRGDRPNACEYWDSAVHFDQRFYVERQFAATANLFVRAAVFEQHRGFRSDLVSGGDREFCTRLCRAGERLAYVADAVVAHRARATLKAAYRKSVRLALAHGRLHELGAMPSRWGCIRKVGAWRCPPPRDWAGRARPHVIAQATLLHNLNTWSRAAICLVQGLGTARHSWRTAVRGWVRLARRPTPAT
jgi:glycosyltransferase AglI